MAGATGVVRSELAIGPLRVRGDADRLLVALSPESNRIVPPGDDAVASEAGEPGAVATATQRLDLLARQGG